MTPNERKGAVRVMKAAARTACDCRYSMGADRHEAKCLKVRLEHYAALLAEGAVARKDGAGTGYHFEIKPIVVEGFPDAVTLRFHVGAQSFLINDWLETEEQARWMQRQFANALAATGLPADDAPVAGWRCDCTCHDTDLHPKGLKGPWVDFFTTCHDGSCDNECEPYPLFMAPPADDALRKAGAWVIFDSKDEPFDAFSSEATAREACEHYEKQLGEKVSASPMAFIRDALGAGGGK